MELSAQGVKTLISLSNKHTDGTLYFVSLFLGVGVTQLTHQ